MHGDLSEPSNPNFVHWFLSAANEAHYRSNRALSGPSFDVNPVVDLLKSGVLAPTSEYDEMRYGSAQLELAMGEANFFVDQDPIHRAGMKSQLAREIYGWVLGYTTELREHSPNNREAFIEEVNASTKGIADKLADRYDLPEEELWLMVVAVVILASKRNFPEFQKMVTDYYFSP